MIDYVGLFPVAVALIGTLILAYTDLKTTYMPDIYTHSMIAVGLIWLAFFDSSKVYTLLVAGGTFAILFLMYLFGQIGGGDAKLFTAIALLVPKFPKSLAPLLQSIGINPVTNSPIPFVFTVFLLAGLIGPMFTISIWYFIKLYKIKRKVKEYNSKLIKAILLLLLVLPFTYYFYVFSKAFAVIFVPVLTSMLILPFKNDVLEHFAMKKKKISKLDDDDVLALEFIPESKKKKLGLWRKTFTSPELKKIKAKAKKLKIKEVRVYDYLPQFGPFIFIALLLNLLVGDFLIYLVMNA